MSKPKNWLEIRAVVLFRDDYECQICRDAEATEADHIWPKSAGGPDDLNNLQAACKPCNLAKGSRYDVFEATMQQLMWLQTHLNKAADKAKKEADGNRYWLQTYGAAIAAAVHNASVISVDDKSDPDSEIARTFVMLSRVNWTGGSYAYISREQVARSSHDARKAAETEYRNRLADCDAADAIAHKMEETDSGDLEDYCRFERGLRGVWYLMGSYLASGEADL